MNRQEFRRLATIRLRDAEQLLAVRRFDGAYYLAGYAVECGLKACISRQTRRGEFPDKDKAKEVHTHNLVKLLSLAGLEGRLQIDGAADPLLPPNWATAKDWRETSRYGRKTKKDAQDLLGAIADPDHGVMEWIKKYW